MHGLRFSHTSFLFTKLASIELDQKGMKSWPQMTFIEPTFAFAARGGPLTCALAQCLPNQPPRGEQFSPVLEQLANGNRERVHSGL